MLTRKETQQVREEEVDRLLKQGGFNGHLRWTRKRIRAAVADWRKLRPLQRYRYWRKTQEAAIERAAFCAAFAQISMEQADRLAKKIRRGRRR